MKHFLFILNIFIISLCFSQTNKEIHTPPTNNILAGVFSEGTYISLGYEHLFTSKKTSEITHAVGIFVGKSEEFKLCLNGYGHCTAPEVYHTVHVHYSLNLGKKRSRFEIGIATGGVGKAVGVSALMGYRFVPLKKNNFSFRITASYPVLLTGPTKMFYMPLGASLGFSF